MRVEFGSAMVECYDMGFGNAPGRNDSSNRKRFSLLKSVYSNSLLLEVWALNGFDVALLRGTSKMKAL
jgi:hypothetical protein